MVSRENKLSVIRSERLKEKEKISDELQKKSLSNYNI